ncbi:MAG: hypothetical protein KDA44_12875 [Planctomycetales bacterium]|nr:hypothetical protein [Planctomycetales bacterium]
MNADQRRIPGAWIAVGDREGAARRTPRPLLASLMLALAIAGPAAAQGTVDRIQRRNGVDSGTISAVTPLGVTISKSGVESTVPVEEIRSVRYAGEPNELNSARIAAAAGRYRDAYDQSLQLAKSGITRPEIMADVQFLAASSQAALALAGQEDLDKALTAVRGFLAQQRSSYHLPEAIELYGDLLLRSGQYEGARGEYAKLAKAKSDYFELRSALLLGRAWQAEGKQTEALAEFDKVLAARGGGALIEPLKLAATLDKAVSQAAAGDTQQATVAIGKIIAAADAEDEELLARAYNALGDAYQKSGDVQGAVFSYLHVDLLLNNVGDAHAKALSQLAKLWKSAGHEDRGRDAAERLLAKYPESRWAGDR